MLGHRKRFNMDKVGYTDEDDLLAHDGQWCLVLRATSEVDTAHERSGMYRVRFDDGFEAEAYPDELGE